MVVFPNIKINLGLFVTDKRADGFHNLESIFYPIPWLDVLEINLSNDFDFTASGIQINGNTDSNLVVKAFQLLKNKYSIPNCHIHLHKQIPMGAGLGGGSADAAFTLNALNQLFDLNIPMLTLEKMADSLGSDCAFFIKNQPAFVSGKGENVQVLPSFLSGYYIKLVNPGIHVDTKMAFSGIKPSVAPIDLSQIKTAEDFFKSQNITNDFEQTVFKTHPEIKSIKTKLLKENALYASMSGTGSTVYGIFKDQPDSTFTDETEKIFKLT